MIRVRSRCYFLRVWFKNYTNESYLPNNKMDYKLCYFAIYFKTNGMTYVTSFLAFTLFIKFLQYDLVSSSYSHAFMRKLFMHKVSV